MRFDVLLIRMIFVIMHDSRSQKKWKSPPESNEKRYFVVIKKSTIFDDFLRFGVDRIANMPDNESRSRGQDMERVLMNEFYSGSTVAEAIDFAERCYCEKVSEKTLEKVCKKIKENTGKNWK